MRTVCFQGCVYAFAVQFLQNSLQRFKLHRRLTACEGNAASVEKHGRCAVHLRNDVADVKVFAFDEDALTAIERKARSVAAAFAHRSVEHPVGYSALGTKLVTNQLLIGHYWR